MNNCLTENRASFFSKLIFSFLSRGWQAAVWFIILLVNTGDEAAGQNRVVLRDLTVLTDRTVVSFSQESVRLDDGTELGWDEVLKADLAADQQDEFDRNVREIGLPLYRMKRRILIADWSRLDQIAETLLIRYSGIDSATGKAVCLAAAKGKLERYSRAEAVLPFVMACHKSSLIEKPLVQSMGFRTADLESGVSWQLLPVWFDSEEVAKAVVVLKDYESELKSEFPDGGHLYLASFYLAQDQLDQARESLDKVDAAHSETRQWKYVLDMERKRRAAEGLSPLDPIPLDSIRSPAVRAFAHYLDSRALDRLGEASPTKRILAYLKVAALWGDEFPNLAASSIYQAIQVAEGSNLVEESKTLRAELLRRYSRSYHGRLLKQRLQPSTVATPGG